MFHNYNYKNYTCNKWLGNKTEVTYKHCLLYLIVTIKTGQDLILTWVL